MASSSSCRLARARWMSSASLESPVSMYPLLMSASSLVSVAQVPETPGHFAPLEVFQEGVDVVGALATVVQHEGVLPVIRYDQQVLLDRQEIGRASCRERVEVSVAAV